MKKISARLLLCLLSTVWLARAGNPKLVTGEIHGAKFTIAAPEKWNGCLLLLAHGFRPDAAPLLADLDTNDVQFAALLREGWIIASTSYRRNGLIIRDAIADLDALQTEVARRWGRPRQSFVQGESMGGTIAMLIAERGGTNYTAALAIGAALQAQEDTNPWPPTGQPKLPLLFLSNRTEANGPTFYTKTVPVSPKPAVWRVDRDGHVNVNSAERKQALAGLVAWADGKEPVRERDGTVSPKPGPSLAKFTKDTATAVVRKVNPFYGNLTLGFQAKDLEHLGLAPRSHFHLNFASGEVTVLWGADFDDVPRGEWVAFLDAEGWLFVSRNWADAAKSAQVKMGDRAILSR